MSLAVFPTDPPQTKKEVEEEIREVKAKHVAWLVGYVLEEELPPIKHALDECYALLAPVLPGSTLVLSTPRNERVKGTVTRVGTRIVKANMHLQLQTFPAQTVSLRPKCNVHMPQLVTLTSHLNEATKITTTTFDFPADPSFLKAQLRLLSDLVTDSIAILKGPSSLRPTPTPPSSSSSSPSPQRRPPTADDDLDTTWTVQSCASEHLEPDPGAPLSCHFTLSDSLIILTIRVLEPARAPVALGTKLGLAIGTLRRIEHDESARVFDYVHRSSDPAADGGDGHDHDHDHGPFPAPHPARAPDDPVPSDPKPPPQRRGGGGGRGGGGAGAAPTTTKMTTTPEKITPGVYTPVVVREKVRVETADPKLMSLLAKLSSLKVTLARVEANLATVLENRGGG